MRGRVDDHRSGLLSRNADFSGPASRSPEERVSDVTVQVLLASTTEYRSKQYS